MILARFLESLIRQGELTLTDANGVVHRMGDPTTGPIVHIRLHDRKLHIQFWINPRLYVGEAYMNGTMTVEQGSIYDFLDLVGLNTGEMSFGRWDSVFLHLRKLWRGFAQANPASWARKNVAHHYDLSDDLYALFLDSDRQYSCAYFTEPGMTLEAAQEAKKRHIAAKLCLSSEHRVLDLGSGWGGMGLYLARTTGARVTGITLSKEQHRVSQERAKQEGLSDRVDFQLCDYRELSGQFDRIVSVGMFEHVGTPHYRQYFRKVHELLSPDGVALVHTIAHRDLPSSTNPWLRKYIFPGGYCPSLSEILPVTEATGLWTTDIEILRLHYAETLRHWRQRFLAHWDQAAALYDQRFCRMWEFYLAGCEMAFRHQGQMVAQIQLTKRMETLPLTRDYMVEWEAEQADQQRPKRRLKSVG